MLIIIFNLFQNLDGSLLQVLTEVIAADLNGQSSQSQKTDSQNNDSDGKNIDTENTDKKSDEPKSALKDMSKDNLVKVQIMPKYFRGGGLTCKENL